MEREESWPGTVTPLWTVPGALTASLQPAVLCKRAPAHAVAAAARSSDQIEDQRATSRASESIPSRHHRAKTTPQQ